MAYDVATSRAELSAREKLLYLRDYIAGLPESRFDMAYFTFIKADKRELFPANELLINENACG